MAAEQPTTTDLNDLLYHYTGLESFVSIIHGGEFWAGHIRYQNDVSEQRLIWDHVRARIQARLNASDGTEHERLLKFQTLANAPLEMDIYLICFKGRGRSSKPMERLRWSIWCLDRF